MNLTPALLYISWGRGLVPKLGWVTLTFGGGNISTTEEKGKTRDKVAAAVGLGSGNSPALANLKLKEREQIPLYLFSGWVTVGLFSYENKNPLACSSVIPRVCGFYIFIGAEGGSRTHTGCEPRRILSPLRLPVPPLRHIIFHATTILTEKNLSVNLTIWTGGDNFSQVF